MDPFMGHQSDNEVLSKRLLLAAAELTSAWRESSVDELTLAPYCLPLLCVVCIGEQLTESPNTTLDSTSVRCTPPRAV